ncbi:ABC transporter permease [Mycoplasmoides pirum]|uniref:ABC transporter permease n=1 Tax=Mycoplasmoides pirum TaxID=2122 RepID=UPI00047FF5BE|nr:ABC transporter permease [Mycoplasmoides pirum]
MTSGKFRSSLRQSYIWIILMIIYLPLLVVIIISFNNSTIRGNINLVFGVPDSGIGSSAYDKLVSDGDFVDSLINSLIIAVVVTPISVIIATAASFAIWNNKAIYRKTTIGLSNASISTPEIIAGLSLIILFTLTWLSFNQSLGLFTIIVSHISFCTPYALVAIYPRMQKMSMNLILASSDLGYNKTQTFFKITVPYLMPGILSGAAIAFAMSFDDFIITNLVRGSTQTISSQLYTMRKGVKAWAAAFGSIIIFITIFITIALSIQKFFIEKSKHREKVIRRSQHLNRINIKDFKKQFNQQKVK